MKILTIAKDMKTLAKCTMQYNKFVFVKRNGNLFASKNPSLILLFIIFLEDSIE